MYFKETIYVPISLCASPTPTPSPPFFVVLSVEEANGTVANHNYAHLKTCSLRPKAKLVNVLFQVPSFPWASSSAVNRTKHRCSGRSRTSDILLQLKEKLAPMDIMYNTSTWSIDFPCLDMQFILWNIQYPKSVNWKWCIKEGGGGGK